MRACCAVVAIGVKSETAPAVTSCEGDGETQSSEDEDSEQMGGILGVDVVRDCGEASAGVGPLLGGKQGLARWVEAGLEAFFEVGMVCVDCPVLPSSVVGRAICGRLGWGLCSACC